MQDSAVEPAGLFDVRRQRRLLDSLAQRYRDILEQQHALQTVHAQQRSLEESQFGNERAEVASRCRLQRRRMLQQWDDAEEQLIRRYETQSVSIHQELERLSSILQQRELEATQTIRRKVAAREQAVLNQYENRKHQPGSQHRQELHRLEQALEPLRHLHQQAHAMTLRRLEQVPPSFTDPTEIDGAATEALPEVSLQSIDDALEQIHELTARCQAIVDEMRTSAVSRLAESYLLPGGSIALAALWGLIAYGVTGGSMAWTVAGVLPAVIIGFVVYLSLMLPLKRATLRLYPQVERIAGAAHRSAAAGRQVSADAAAAAATELQRNRDEHLSATQRWRDEQLAQLQQRLQDDREAEQQRLKQVRDAAEQQYIQSFSSASSEMRTLADAVAQQITAQLTTTDQRLQCRRDALAAQQVAQLEHLNRRLDQGIRGGLQRISQATRWVQQRFPDWPQVLAAGGDQGCSLDFLPLGYLQVGEHLRDALHVGRSPSQTQGNGHGNGHGYPNGRLSAAEIPLRMPLGLHRRLYSAMVVQCAGPHLNQAIELVHQLLWRLLTSAPPGHAKLTLVDPLGRGQNFAGFMALADHDPTILDHRVWTTGPKIERRLAALADHVEDVLQVKLRDRFERVEDYNRVAGSMAEPYRAVAAIGFPEELSRTAHRHLVALIESGLRCGIVTALVCDKARSWPADMPLPGGDKVLHLEIDDQGLWHLAKPGLQELTFQPLNSPPAPIRAGLIEHIGSAAVAAARVEVPLHEVISPADDGTGSSADGLRIAIGSQGANRSLSLELGAGVRQHVLIAGKTGAGKSSLLHAMISSAAHHYRSDELHFYLLDFKKGVEFKPYADVGLPHARVIGIESEREFGRSVLRRLDAELQRRGEAFRAASAQNLAEYRRSTGQTLPRIMLVIDEFQELFVRDDRLAGDCTMLLDRLVRQGRSFGMHVVLSSQSLAGTYSLPRATLGQLAVRIAMQCSESDAALILSDDNSAARLISRPGEAIYNDAGGRIEGNQPFQVAWLAPERHLELLRSITARDHAHTLGLDPPVVFAGNRPCQWSPSLADAAASAGPRGPWRGLLGEAVEIGPPLAIELTRDAGRGLLLIAPCQARRAVIGSVVSGIAKSDPRLKVLYFDGHLSDDAESAAPWLTAAGVSIRTIDPREAVREMSAVAESVNRRSDQQVGLEPILVVIDPLERFREFRQDESFHFSLDQTPRDSGGDALQTVLSEGPAVGVFTLLICRSAQSFSRWLPRSSQHDLELRILGQLNQADSSLLIDSPAAAELTSATLLLYDDHEGRITKFRWCDLPPADAIKRWLGDQALAR